MKDITTYLKNNMSLEVTMNNVVWRIIYKNIDWQDWKPIDRLYSTKGAATGVLKRGRQVAWEDKTKVWITPDGKLVFKIQSSELEWEDYESC